MKPSLGTRLCVPLARAAPLISQSPHLALFTC